MNATGGSRRIPATKKRATSGPTRRCREATGPNCVNLRGCAPFDRVRGQAGVIMAMRTLPHLMGYLLVRTVESLILSLPPSLTSWNAVRSSTRRPSRNS